MWPGGRAVSGLTIAIADTSSLMPLGTPNCGARSVEVREAFGEGSGVQAAKWTLPKRGGGAAADSKKLS